MTTRELNRRLLCKFLESARPPDIIFDRTPANGRTVYIRVIPENESKTLSASSIEIAGS